MGKQCSSRHRRGFKQQVAIASISHVSKLGSAKYHALKMSDCSGGVSLAGYDGTFGEEDGGWTTERDNEWISDREDGGVSLERYVEVAQEPEAASDNETQDSFYEFMPAWAQPSAFTREYMSTGNRYYTTVRASHQTGSIKPQDTTPVDDATIDQLVVSMEKVVIESPPSERKSEPPVRRSERIKKQLADKKQVAGKQQLTEQQKLAEQKQLAEQQHVETSKLQDPKQQQQQHISQTQIQLISKTQEVQHVEQKSKTKQPRAKKPPSPPKETSRPPPKERKAIVLKAPDPTLEYMMQANGPAIAIDTPQCLLVALDLNGTLLYRPLNPLGRKIAKQSVHRDHLQNFFQYLFQHHHVAIFSSSTERNVHIMIDTFLPAQLKQSLCAIKSREHMGIPAHLFHQKVTTYKQLKRLWSEVNSSNSRCKHPTGKWDQKNTVLIDDSVLKASSEPFNHVQVPDFTAETHALGPDDALKRVAGYLEAARRCEDVSAYMRMHPFSMEEEYICPF